MVEYRGSVDHWAGGARVGRWGDHCARQHFHQRYVERAVGLAAGMRLK